MKNNFKGNHSMPPKRKFSMKTLKRVLKMLFKFYPVLFPLTIVCIVFSSIVATLPAIFNQQIIAAIEEWYLSRDWQGASQVIIPKIITLASFYVLSLLAVLTQTQLMAYMTQGFLGKMRKTLFSKMQNLPISYFDQNKHGDIMSHYTNDIDTLRMLISQSIPAVLQASIIVVTVFGIMLWYSFWITLVVVVGVIALFNITKKVGGGSAKYFMRQQKAVGKTEGYIQEIMNGQKVVKVFCREDKVEQEFNKMNEEL